LRVKNIYPHFLQVFSLHFIASKSFPDSQKGKPAGGGDVIHAKDRAHRTREPVATSYARSCHYGMTPLQVCTLFSSGLDLKEGSRNRP
jgi:hypothetical protein